MSPNNSSKSNVKAQIEARIAAKKRAKHLAVQKHITIFTLLALLIIGLVSTTFASITPAQLGESGSLVVDVQTVAVNSGHKVQIADTRANIDVAQTSATITGGTVFYLSPNSNWTQSNAWFAAYFCNGSSAAQWVKAELDSSGYYKVTVPSGQSHANIIWVRMNPASTALDWSNKWNQSGDLVWNGSSNLCTINSGQWDCGSNVTWSTYTPPTPFAVGDVVYFDIRNNTSWLTADSSSQMYVQFNDSTTGSTSNRSIMTRIGTYLYMYEFTSECSGSIRFWRGNSSSMWNYSKSLSAADGNGVYIASNGWSGSGTVATFTLTGLSAPTLTVSPDTINLGQYTTLNGSSVTPTLSYKIGTTAYETTAIASDLKYSFKSGTSSITTGVASGEYVYEPATSGTFSITTTVTSTATGLSATSSAKTLTVKALYTYTISANTGGSVSPVSGSVEEGTSVSITATPNTGYTFVSWTGVTNGTVGSATSATTTFTPTKTGATVKANFRPDAPSALTLTGSNVALDTSGTGTSANPYIVFEDGGFILTANATVVSGATARYSTSASSSYSTTNTFSPSLDTKGTAQSYTVYAKAIAGGYYSNNSINATAYYMVFSHLDGANTGFTMSSDSITDIESVTFSDAYINGVVDAEKTYITQTYQISTNNSTFSDISGTTWTPDAVGTYYFRVKTTNTKTGETVYSSSQEVTVTQSTVYYDIIVTNDGTVDGTVTLKTGDTTITDGKILSNSPLSVSITRPSSNYYIDYLEIDTLTEQDNSDVNGDITDYIAIDHVKGNVYINYKIVEKPKVTVKKPANASSIQFAYYVDNVVTYATTVGTYHVDYNDQIKYTVTPNTGYYVSEMTGVTIGDITSSAVSGAKNNVVSDISEVNATLVSNNTVTVNVDETSDVTEGGLMTIDGVAQSFSLAKPLNYGTASEIIITPPDGYYAVVSGNDVESTISTDGKATFNVTLTGTDKVYTVRFVTNPKIFMVQPQYGSVYVTDDAGNYYFNGDSVGYGTKLTVNAKPDHANAKLSNVLVNNTSIGTTDGSTFNIKVDSTATATITVDSKFVFDTNTAYGTRRIIFTDTFGWGNGNVSVHYSNTSGDTDFSSNSIVMTQKYLNEYSQYVYYADIPFSSKYLTFFNNSNTAQKSAQATISDSNNAYFCSNTSGYPGAINTWILNYSDYIATDRAETIQQATTSKGNAAIFQYTCDFGDGALSAEVVSGNAATFDFDKGTLSITPTANTYNHTLVKVTSSASGTVKYYLIKVESFEILSFTGLQKIYNTNVFNDIQLDLILKGGVLNYAAKYLISDTNASGSYTELEGTSSGFEKVDSLEGYINSFLIKYAINTISGVKYYKVEASDSANHSATATAKTLFGTNTYNGERVIYFYNDTNVNLSKYKLRACFIGEDESNKTFVTMQRVGDTDYYRAVIPDGVDYKVNFYLCNPKTFSNDYADFDGTDDTTEFYSFGVRDVILPKININDYESVNAANIVFRVTSIDTENGITGELVDFDY